MAYSKAQLAQLVTDYANNYGIDPAVALVQIKRESANFRSDVVNGPFVAGAGERGLAQFTPATWIDWGSGPHTNAYNPEASLTAWGRYMTWLLRRYGGNYTKALQGYNGGPGNVDRGTVSSGAQRYAREILAAAGSSSSGGGSSLPDSSYPDIVFCGEEGQPPCPDASAGGASDNPQPPPQFSSPALLIGGAAILLFVLISD